MALAQGNVNGVKVDPAQFSGDLADRTQHSADRRLADAQAAIQAGFAANSRNANPAPGRRPDARLTGFSRKGNHHGISRRIFLRNSAIAMVGVGSAPLWLQRAASPMTRPDSRKKVLVAIFQRGAADGLNIVVPHGEQRYYDLRPTISVPRPSAALPPTQRHRSRRLLRPASLARASEAAVGPAAWRSFTPPVRPTPRARTSTRRITWNRARPA
jgi:hypothetical protein